MWWLRIWSLVGVSIVGVLMAPSAAPAEDVLAGDVPIPADAHVVSAPPEASEAAKRFSGAWVGSWGGERHHLLIVESVETNGAARVVYAVGNNTGAGTGRQWQRYQATISGDTLTIAGVFTATYTLRPPDRLTANFRLATAISEATLSRIDLADLTRPRASIAWRMPTEFLNTGLQEDGRPVRLEVVIDKPAGDGPFPLLVFNHGSTGLGRRPALFGMTSWSPNIAHFFVRKGWMVAFPQRRGRGKSDGLYDEGFAPDRAQGYTCDPARSLAGADRALDDIEAAVTALRERPDVSRDRIVVGGASRGGILSIAYAAAHRAQVRGVVNFVGGWVGEGCRSAGEINGILFGRGAKFADPTLWLYGHHDSFYSIGHSRSNFDAFTRAGGRGDFMEFDVPSGEGHRLIGHPALWTEPVEKYLTAITENNGSR
jgi:dienelactone hydrolase